MKRLFLSLLAVLMLGCAVSFAAINKSLQKAENLYGKATTLADFQAAMAAYENAKNDIAYTDEEHGAAINNGITNCKRQILRLSPRLQVNGNSNGSNSNVGAEGGSISFKIKTNIDGQVDVKGLPAWLTVASKSNTEIVLTCAPNDETMSRQASISFRAGNARVKCAVRQAGVPVIIADKAPSGSMGEGQPRQESLEIVDVQFVNVLYDNTVITAAGQPLYAHEMRYLRPIVTYLPLTEWKNNVPLKTKIYKPDGTMYYYQNYSPEGYTQGYEQDFDNQLTQQGLTGFGHRNKSVFDPGQYKFEFYLDGDLAYTAYANIIEREDDETYLMLNGQMRPDLELGGQAGEARFFISTSDADWTVSELPSWISLVKKDDNSITIAYTANDALKPREGEFYINGAGRQVTAKVVQKTNGPSATIENVTLLEHQTVNGVEGIKITAKVKITNAKNQRCQIVAWFYHGDGKPLMDTDGKYRAGDGQVTVNTDVTPTDDVLDMPEFTLFLPYDQLDITEPGDSDLEFDMGIYDFSIRDFLASTRRVKFIYTRK